MPPWLAPLLQNKPILIGAAAAVILVILTAGFLFVKRKKKPKVSAEAAAAVSGGEKGSPALEGPSAQAKLEDRLANYEADRERLESEALASLQLPAHETKKSEVLTKHLRSVVKKDPGGAAQLLRTWLREESG